MGEHRCQYVVEWQIDDKFMRQVPLEYCNAPAAFQNDLGIWNCAEHFQMMQAEFDKWRDYDQGVCSVCNCEFFEGECNCEFYAEN